MPASKEFATVGTFATLMEAETLRGILEDEGIPAFVTGGDLLAVQPYLAPALGNVGLQVRRADAERALAVLGKHEVESRKDEDVVLDDVEDRSETACLACGAEFPEYLERCPACGLSYS